MINIYEVETTDYVTLRRTIAFEQRNVVVYGKVYQQPRLTKWYGEVAYEYSGLRWEPCKMPPLLVSLRDRVAEACGISFNSVLCNLYRNGQDTVGWHADNEFLFGVDPVVASLSFGTTRKFLMRPRKKNGGPEQSFDLSDGTLLVMEAGVQATHLHSVPRTDEEVGERINLTFRNTI